MTTETPRAETEQTTRQHDDVETTRVEWASPDFIEQSACAEICAYVFTA